MADTGTEDFAHRRVAISSAYYALFHALSYRAATALIGEADATRTERAWLQTYRSFAHTTVKAACVRATNQKAALGFPAELSEFIGYFPTAQELRHRADYDPSYDPERLVALSHVETVGRAITGLEQAGFRHVRAFAAYVLFEQGRKNVERDRA